MNSKLGFYLGRFQPYSLKHMEITRFILDKFPDLSLNIGVAGWRGEQTRDNFLSGEEAAHVIRLTLTDFNLQDAVGIKIIELSPELTVEESVEKILPNGLPITFFSGSGKTIGALERIRDRGNNININILPDDDITPPRAREIRKGLLSSCGEWKCLVSPSAVEYLQQFQERLIFLPEGGVKRPWKTEGDLNLGIERK